MSRSGDPGRFLTTAAPAVSVLADHEAMSRAAADQILDAVRAKPRLLLGVATGGTPTRTYDLLAAAARSSPTLFDQVRIVKLDEWGGLAPDDPASCETYVRRHLLSPLGVGPDRYLGWATDPADPPAECERVAGWLRANGPIGLCVLGLGANGHLAFNEPGPSLTPGPHVAALTPASMAHPMLGDARGRPRYGLTLGMADLLAADRVLMLVSGAAKAGVFARLADPRVSTDFPASFLWLHPRVTVICDRAAAADVDRPSPP